MAFCCVPWDTHWLQMTRICTVFYQQPDHLLNSGPRSPDIQALRIYSCPHCFQNALPVGLSSFTKQYIPEAWIFAFHPDCMMKSQLVIIAGCYDFSTFRIRRIRPRVTYITSYPTMRTTRGTRKHGPPSPWRRLTSSTLLSARASLVRFQPGGFCHIEFQIWFCGLMVQSLFEFRRNLN